MPPPENSPQAPKESKFTLFLAYTLLGAALLYLGFVTKKKFFSENLKTNVKASFSYAVSEFGGVAFRGYDFQHLQPFDLIRNLEDGEIIVLKEATHLLLRHQNGTEITFKEACVFRLMPEYIELIEGKQPELINPHPGFAIVQSTKHLVP